MHTRQSSTQSDINQVSHCYNNSRDDGHMAARNMWRIEINTQEKIVLQFGYLQRIDITFRLYYNKFISGKETALSIMPPS